MKDAATGGQPQQLWPTFCLGSETFAINAKDIQEVIREQPLTPVPLAAGHVVGLLNLRGQIMPAIDLRYRLRFDKRPAGEPNVFLVIKHQDSLISLIVDGVGDVLEAAENAWEPVPETLTAPHRDFVFGIYPTESKVVLGLRVQSLSGDDEVLPRGL